MLTKKTNTIETTESKLFVGLGSTIAFSRWDSYSTSAKLEELSKDKNLTYVQVDSLLEASELVRKFIKQYNLGASNWTGGIVLNEDLNFVARVSYNGRVWDNSDRKKAKEIILC